MCNQKVFIALSKVYGIGITLSKKICNKLNINTLLVADLSDHDLLKIRDFIEKSNILIEGELRRQIVSNVCRLVKIKSYRGSRHKLGLPVRGQRTHTNARTSKKIRFLIN